MNIQRTIETTITVSIGEVIEALKLLKPGILDLTRLPDTGTGVAVISTGRNLTLTTGRTAMIGIDGA